MDKKGQAEEIVEFTVTILFLVFLFFILHSCSAGEKEAARETVRAAGSNIEYSELLRGFFMFQNQNNSDLLMDSIAKNEYLDLTESSITFFSQTALVGPTKDFEFVIFDDDAEISTINPKFCGVRKLVAEQKLPKKNHQGIISVKLYQNENC